ncbi:hypothetical protein BOTBODRAFT_173034 [Botryobasidium botryosum FD-172 SS1]|uniref:F-box domain-containing protein n=1 Tax=Botryobasidium botryosum (strain FD-172 SS1) TaxID=930990 RepID=A0A067MXA0_BOTB1|nr:hypothetical protein BOTBODRAFT_173034 [Botryobasidium botryosum FD-172 SS1]
MARVGLSADVVHNIYQCSDTEELIKISQVCRLWRSTLHRSTEFWTEVDLDLRKRDPDVKAAYWLARAGNRLLTIQIHSGWGVGDAQRARVVEACIVRLAITLRECMNRWESVDIRAYSLAIDLLLSVCAGYALNLKSLTIQATKRSPGSDERLLVPLHLPIDHQAGGSTLYVSIHGYIPRFTTFGLLITELAVQFDFETTLKADDILRMLQSCPNLVRCDINALGSGRLGASSLAQTVMHRLATFSISWVEDVESIFNSLQLPALQSLSLQQVDWTTAAMSSLWRVLRASHSVSYIVITDEDPEYESDTVPAPFHEEMLTLEAVTSFEMCGNPLTRPISRHLSLPHIQKLDLTDAPFDIVHRYISSSTGLRDLSLHGIIEVPLYPTVPLPVSLPALTSLYIAGFPGFVDYIHAPQLRSLVLIHKPTRPERLSASLRTLVEKSNPALITLGLHGAGINDEDIIWCSERLPQVENLDLSSCSISDAVLRALAAPLSPENATPHRLLPRLERIELSNNKHITPQGVIEFLASRNASSGPSGPRITGKIDFFGRVSREEAQTIMSYSDFFNFALITAYRKFKAGRYMISAI